MPRKKIAGPWFRKSRGRFYATFNGKQYDLETDDEKKAWDKYHILAATALQPVDERGLPVDGIAIGDLIVRFLDWAQKNRAKLTYDEYNRYQGDFVKHVGAARLASSLIPYDVTTWLDTRPELKDGGRRSAIAAVKRCLNWAAEERLIPFNPIASIKKPSAGTRTTVFRDDEQKAILAAASDSLRLILTVMLETGIRPDEARRAEKRHCELDAKRIVFPMHEHKTGRKTKAPRVVYLTAAAVEILKALCERHSDGPLFRDEQGRPWTRHTIKDQFEDMEETLGWRPFAYGIRHTYITQAIENGVDLESLRNQVGHADLSMIARHYSHIAQNQEHMRKTAEKARTKTKTEELPAKS